MMELSEDILKDAHQALSKGMVTLPLQIPSAPRFFLASADDKTIMAFGGIVHEGVSYKIGVRRE
jgi:hypothetical protein